MLTRYKKTGKPPDSWTQQHSDMSRMKQIEVYENKLWMELVNPVYELATKELKDKIGALSFYHRALSFRSLMSFDDPDAELERIKENLEFDIKTINGEISFGSLRSLMHRNDINMEIIIRVLNHWRDEDELREAVIPYVMDIVENTWDPRDRCWKDALPRKELCPLIKAWVVNSGVLTRSYNEGLLKDADVIFFTSHVPPIYLRQERQHLIFKTQSQAKNALRRTRQVGRDVFKVWYVISSYNSDDEYAEKVEDTKAFVDEILLNSQGK